MKNASIGLYGLLVLLLASCTDKKETTPVYLKIDSFSVQVSQPELHGSTSSKITDAWVFVNDNLVGGFELPALVPVLVYQPVNSIKIRAGINNSGSSALRIEYPFYTEYSIDTLLTKSSVVQLKPVVNYVSNAEMVFNEDFEDPSLSLVSYQSTGLDITRQNTTPFEGGYSGKIVMNATNSLMQIKTDPDLPLNTQADFPLYLEMNFKSDAAFAVDVIAHESDGPVILPLIVLYSTSGQWKKIYLDLRPAMGKAQNGSDFNILFSSALPSGSTSATVELDNVKIIQVQP